jgi:GT2 family glycosyltransferase
MNEPAAADQAQVAGRSIGERAGNVVEGHGISVIVPVHNGGQAFRRCLSRVSALSPTPLEVIVIADGDADGSAELARGMGFAVLELPDCRGPARARNLGAGEARGDILLFLDADVEVPSDAIARVAKAFVDHENWVALFGSYDDQPGAANFLSQYRNLFHHYIHQTGNQEASTFWAGCGAIRRDVFAAAGGFSETYARPCIEDIELGLRLRRSGHSIGLCKD